MTDHAICVDCGGARHPKSRNKGNRCRPCANKARAKARPTCTECGAEMGLNPRRKGTLCFPCNSRLIGRTYAHVAAAAQREAMKDPVRRAERAQRLVSYLSSPEGKAQRAAEAKRRSEKHFAWCPAAYRPMYDSLRKKDRIKAAEAKRLVIEHIAHDEAVRRRTISDARRSRSFEDQLAAVRAGAIVVPKFVKPRIAPQFTLGGSVGEIG